MKIYNVKKRSFPSGPQLLGLLFTGVGLFTVASPVFIESSASLQKPLLVGSGAVFLGLMLLSSYGGTLLDFNRKTVKEYASFLGYKFGKWSILPKISSIAVIRVKHKTTNTPNGISPTWSGTVNAYGVFLYAENSRAVLSFEFATKKRAIAAAKHLAANLNARYDVKVPDETGSLRNGFDL